MGRPLLYHYADPEVARKRLVRLGLISVPHRMNIVRINGVDRVVFQFTPKTVEQLNRLIDRRKIR